MSTIPTTFKKLKIPYTIAGGQKESGNKIRIPGLSIILLNRGGRVFRRDTLGELSRFGPYEILSLENSRVRYDIEKLSREFPHVRFLLPETQPSPGELLNLGMEECRGKWVLVIWNDMKVLAGGLSERLLQEVEAEGPFCVVPGLLNKRQELMPTLQAPAFYRKNLKVLSLLPGNDNTQSLYPYDYCGLYNRKKFQLSGGFDPTIPNPYWQKLDFGFRAFLWGETIPYRNAFRVQYLLDREPEDTSIDESYKRFFLKNLTLRFNGDAGVLPAAKFWPYYLRSGSDFISAVKEFRSVRQWVAVNRYRYKYDARSVTELWNSEER